ncbi:MAG: PadR family transcriptional regulator [Caulobacter sp. 32-67-35]|nr:MAG: PadR family transcriptional regulator [Caulobacter sp. 32-67-35]OZA72527.1 MAG: PadR family transcriptional regulator [Caulobacter sp. 39-67-4]HQR88723.1 PadR family transcriptional regulator [Caulobacter sp.]
MFGRHHHHHGRRDGGHWGAHHSRHPFGVHGHDHHGRGPGRGGGRMGRFFDHGDLRLVVLKLIAEQPSHGYELIKAVETAAGGAYTPSPGVIYPTLTLLEELGYITVIEAGGGKKLHTITPEGEAFLEANAQPVKSLFERMAEAAARSAAFSPQILRARENLKTALRLKLTAGQLTAEQVDAIAKALDDAAGVIERI